MPISLLERASGIAAIHFSVIISHEILPLHPHDGFGIQGTAKAGNTKCWFFRDDDNVVVGGGIHEGVPFRGFMPILSIDKPNGHSRISSEKLTNWVRWHQKATFWRSEAFKPPLVDKFELTPQDNSGVRIEGNISSATLFQWNKVRRIYVFNGNIFSPPQDTAETKENKDPLQMVAEHHSLERFHVFTNTGWALDVTQVRF